MRASPPPAPPPRSLHAPRPRVRSPRNFTQRRGSWSDARPLGPRLSLAALSLSAGGTGEQRLPTEPEVQGSEGLRVGAEVVHATQH